MYERGAQIYDRLFDLWRVSFDLDCSARARFFNFLEGKFFILFVNYASVRISITLTLSPPTHLLGTTDLLL
jgi:hypothetical protein